MRWLCWMIGFMFIGDRVEWTRFFYVEAKV